jgi:hypothetical protein
LKSDTTLLQTAQINELDSVADDSLELLQSWHDSDEAKGGGAFLQGIEAAVMRDSGIRGTLHLPAWGFRG